MSRDSHCPFRRKECPHATWPRALRIFPSHSPDLPSSPVRIFYMNGMQMSSRFQLLAESFFNLPTPSLLSMFSVPPPLLPFNCLMKSEQLSHIHHHFYPSNYTTLLLSDSWMIFQGMAEFGRGGRKVTKVELLQKKRAPKRRRTGSILPTLMQRLSSVSGGNFNSPRLVFSKR